MPKCQHPHVAISVEWAEHATLTSIDADDSTAAITRIPPAQYGSRAPDGYWSRAHIGVVCMICGHVAEVTSVDWRQFPKWLTRHWLRLVAAGGLPAEIQRRYHMFEEDRCHPS